MKISETVMIKYKHYAVKTVISIHQFKELCVIKTHFEIHYYFTYKEIVLFHRPCTLFLIMTY